MIDGTIIVNNYTTNDGRYLLPRTARGLYEIYVERIPIFGEPDMNRLLAVVGEELAKIDAGRIKVSRGLREELQQVWNAVALHLEHARYTKPHYHAIPCANKTSHNCARKPDNACGTT